MAIHPARNPRRVRDIYFGFVAITRPMYDTFHFTPEVERRFKNDVFDAVESAVKKRFEKHGKDLKDLIIKKVGDEDTQSVYYFEGKSSRDPFVHLQYMTSSFIVTLQIGIEDRITFEKYRGQSIVAKQNLQRAVFHDNTTRFFEHLVHFILNKFPPRFM